MTARTRRVAGVLLGAALMAAGILVLFAYAAAVSGKQEPPPELIVLMLVSVFVSGPVHLYLHELGHAAVAHAVGFRVIEFSASASRAAHPPCGCPDAAPAPAARLRIPHLRGRDPNNRWRTFEQLQRERALAESGSDS